MNDDYTKVNHKRSSYYIEDRNNDNNKKIKYLKFLVTRTLLSIILVICISIAIKLNSSNAGIIKDYVFKDSLEFTKINNWYQDKFGTLLPPTKSENTEMVFSNNDLKTSQYENYQDGVKISLSKGSPVTLLNGGIVVFIGNQEGYGNTVIIQGNDGIDYWYGGITNTNINLYDYLDKDTLIGEAIDDFIYIVLQKDGNYLKYEEYLAKI